MQHLPPTDPQGHILDTATGPVHVVDEGPRDGVPFVWLHGIPGSVRDFRYLGPELAARGLRSIRVDAPGFGDTPWATFPHPQILQRADWVETVLNALDVDAAVIGGHSFGGTTAMAAAAVWPDRISGLVLICAPGLTRHRGLQFVPPTVMKWLAKGFDHPQAGPMLANVMRKAYVGGGLKADDLSDDDLAHHAQLVGHLNFREQRWSARTVACPTFMFSGGHDPLVEPEVPFALADALADGGRARVEHHHFKHGGHYLQRDQAPFIAATLSTAVADGFGKHVRDPFSSVA